MAGVSDLDAMFLASETPSQHLHVLATMILEASTTHGVVGYETFQARLAERFHLIEPLRQRLRPMPVGPPMWVDDPDLHLDRHLHHVVLPADGGLEALAATAAEIASYPLPRDRPLWEAWFVEGVDKQRNAVIAKIHHAAVDGVSGIFALAAFFDLEPMAQAPVQVSGWTPAPGPDSREVGMHILKHLQGRPGAILRSLQRTTKSAVALTRSNGEETPLPLSGPSLSYNKALTPRRAVAFTSIPLDLVKQVRQPLDASVNDVLVALCAGVLRQYAIRQGELPDRHLVAGVPVSERRPEHGLAGNQMSFLFYGLPVHLADPAERVRFVARSASTAKDLYARSGEGLLGNIATLTPTAAVSPLMRAVSMTRVVNLVPPVINVLISNIHGPDLPLYVAGSELSSIFPMGPLMEGVGLGITAVSYRDEVAFGFMACKDLVPDVQQLADDVPLEIARMLEAVVDAEWA